MSDSAGGALGVLAVGGLAWLGAEALVDAFVLGLLALFVLAGIVVVAIAFVIMNPISTLAGWMMFLAGASTLLMLPFIIEYYVVLGGHTSVNASDLPLWKNLLSIFDFFWLIGDIAAVAGLYVFCEEL